ncbi:MAG: polysaccharide deacetylase family protein [Actinomycetota bacterium]|nr:polysaccharide deacetylase family protein [Actinomycetota bacterium]
MRSRTIVLVVLALGLGLTTVVILSRADSALAVDVDGHSVTLAKSSPTVADALAAAKVVAKAGSVRAAVSGREVVPGANPAKITVNGQVAALETRLRRDDKVQLTPGADTVEPVDARETPGPVPGLPDVERELWQPGKSSATRQMVGRISGEVVSATPGTPEVASRAVTDKVVALTFDDGPDPKYTPSILGILKDEGVPATFCVVGYSFRRYPDLLKAERDAGHAFCDHTLDHAHLPKLAHDGVVSQIQGASDQIVAILGGAPPAVMRPPYGEISPDAIAVAHAAGMRVLTWNVDSQDYNKPSPEKILSNVMTTVKPGSVVLMHDGGGDRSRTVAALRPMIRALKAQVYTFATTISVPVVP